MEANGETGANEASEENLHWNMVLNSMNNYYNFFIFELSRRQRHINNIPEHLVKRLPEKTFQKFGALDASAQENQYIFEDMVNFYSKCQYLDPSGQSISFKKLQDSELNISQQHRNLAILHSLYREWSKDGMEERNKTFLIIINELKRLLPIDHISKAYKYRVLVPGCGLGRLPLEIASNGYCCEGNEFSSYMLVASNFLLNGITKENSYKIYPWINNISNIVQIEDSLESVTVPDITSLQLLTNFTCPGMDQKSFFDQFDDSALEFPRFSMSAGDFLEIYGKDSSNYSAWDCVVTCFFIDTAPVVVEYIECIEKILKPGGVWINFGPLLYHWVVDMEANGDDRYDKSVELSYEEIKDIVQSFGFEFLNESWNKCTYTDCKTSMLSSVYNAVMFSARKKL